MVKKNIKLLSLCIITKNEESKLPVCLSTVKNIVDEIILVDTGSTDNTLQIANEAGAKIYKKKWKNNFSEIRNYALEKANGKWILFLDADEFLSEEDAEKLRSLLDNPMAEGYLFYIDTQIEKYEIISKTQALRLFRNREEYRFQNRVFEHIPDELINSVKDSEITVYHRPDPDRYRLMQELKLNLLEEDIRDNPEDSYLHYVYGIELLNRKKYEQSIKHFQTAFQYINPDQVFTSHLYKLLALSLSSNRNYEEAITISTQGLKPYPFYTDLFYLRGKAYQAIRHYHDAIQDFQKCILLGDAPSSMVSEKGLGSFKAFFALGEVHQELLNIDDSVHYYKQAYISDRSFEDALYRIGTVLNENNQADKIAKTILKLIDPTNPEELMTLIDILCLENKYETALEYIDQLSKMVGIREDVAFIKGICQMMLGNLEAAEEYYGLISEDHPFYIQVLLKRIQNYWFHQQWDKANILLKKIKESPELNESTKKVYLAVHSRLTGKKTNKAELDEQGYQTLAKLIEYLLLMKQDVISNKLLDLLLQAKEESLWIKTGEILAANQELENVETIFNKIQDNNLQLIFKERIAEQLYMNGKLKEVEQFLRLNGQKETGVLGHYIMHKIWLKKTSDFLNTGLRGKKVEKEMKNTLSNLVELISGEN